jgi:two-component system sensor histidine kinase/response regulator
MKTTAAPKAQLSETEPPEVKHREMERALRRRTDDLLTIQKKLDAYTRVLANNVREPLGRVVSFAQMLEEDYASLSEEEVRSYLHVIVRRGREIVGIVDALLAVQSELPTEAAEELVSLDMDSILVSVLHRVAHLVDEHEAEIVVPDSWPASLGHAAWLEEVWANLISNAIEYGGRPPRVELGSSPPTPLPEGAVALCGRDKGIVCFWIKDNGRGLALEEQVKLFTRSDQDPTTEYGLGLALVQRIVGKLGGQVGVDSRPGHGSTFFFTLRRAEGESKPSVI